MRAPAKESRHRPLCFLQDSSSCSVLSPLFIYSPFTLSRLITVCLCPTRLVWDPLLLPFFIAPSRLLECLDRNSQKKRPLVLSLTCLSRLSNSLAWFLCSLPPFGRPALLATSTRLITRTAIPRSERKSFSQYSLPAHFKYRIPCPGDIFDTHIQHRCITTARELAPASHRNTTPPFIPRSPHGRVHCATPGLPCR